MGKRSGLLAGLVLTVAVLGCSGPGEQRIRVKENDPYRKPRAALQRYVEGQPMGSEVSSFPKMVEEVRKADPAKADLLEKGLTDIREAPPAQRAAKAQALLQELPPETK